MSQKTFFTPGPSQMYPGVSEFIHEAIQNDICSISHRSAQYVEIHKKADQELRKLLSLPNDYSIYFIGSASEAWERIFLNCVNKSSFHFVNGSFSKKFYSYGKSLGFDVQKEEVSLGEGCNWDIKSVPEVDMIAFTHNETSSGVSTPLQFIHSAKENHPDAIIAVDCVSSLPYPQLDFSKIDTAFFSVQKCFGLPAGLGVWLVNDACKKKAKQLAEKRIVGGHHTIEELEEKAKKFQTPSTPNVLDIFLLGKVVEKMNETGVDELRNQTDKKAKLLYDFIQGSSFLDFGVDVEEFRSNTVIVANTSIPPKDINDYLEPHNMSVGSGYGSKKESQIRIANFPAHSLESMENLVSLLKKLDNQS